MSDFHRGTRRFDDVEAASFSPDDTDLTVTEDGGDWVAKDTAGNVVLRYDEAAGDWVMGSLNTGLLSLDQGYKIEEDDNSPWTETDARTPASFSLAGEYDWVVVHFEYLQNTSGSTAPGGLRGNGSQAGDFETLQIGNTTFSGTYWKLADALADGEAVSGPVAIQGRWENTCKMNVGFGAPPSAAPIAYSGEHTSLVSPLRSIEADVFGNSVSLRARVLGVTLE